MILPIQSSKRSQFWRRLRRIAVVLAMLVGAIVLYGWWYFERTASAGKADLAAAIAETDALDPDWRWEALEAKRPTIPEAENSVRVIREAAALVGKPNSGSF